MDVFRPGAVPALIGAALLGAALPARADCSALETTFKAESDKVPGRPGLRLANLVAGDEPRDKDALVRVDKPGTGAGFGGTSAPITRAKVTHLPATGTLADLARRPRIVFHDAAGQRLAELPMIEGWKCVGTRLERTGERYSGLGEDLKTLEVAESLETGPDGGLWYRETVTEIEPRRGKPRTLELRFPAAPRQP